MNLHFEPQMSWLDAQTIGERRVALGANPGALAHFDAERADQRLAAWKAVPVFAQDAVFARRVAIDGCTPEEFHQVLGIPADKLFPEGFIPHWLQEVLASEAFESLPFRSLALEDAAQRGMIPSFLPLIHMYAVRLHAVLKTRADLLEGMRLTAESALDLFLNSAIGRIEYQTRRAIALEINVQRILGQLEGETPEERFLFFSRKMNTASERLPFLEKYPVLTRSMQRLLELWVDASVEFMNRLAVDSLAIRAAFGIEPGDALERFQPGAGDIHCKGRSVVILTFKSGKKVLYKPRPLHIDEDYQNLLRWCGDRGLEPRLRTINLLARADYGWVEFVQNVACANIQEMGLFYRRLGAILGLLHALVAVDMHFENIVAAGPDPVIVDLETLFHGEGIAYTDFAWASDLDAQRVRHSVMGVGLLPAPTVTEGNKTFDVSAIGASVGQQAPYKVTLLQNIGKDDVHIAHVPGWIPSVHSRPTEGEQLTIPFGEILEGFRTCYRFLLEHKEMLLASNGPIARFGRNERRLIIRNTRYYGGLGIDAGHPDLLRDDLDRAWHWDNLWNEITSRPVIEKFIASEMRQVEEGDVPFFTVGLDGVDATGADGAAIPGVLPESGMELARARIGRLSVEDLERQSWFIRSSLGYVDGYVRKPARAVDPGETGAWLAAARAVGDQVLADLVHFKETASFLEVACVNAESETGSGVGAYSIGPAGVDLYDGLGGVALFLAYLGKETAHESYTAAAAGLLANIQCIMGKRTRRWSRISGFLGLGSLVYLYSHLACLWNRADLLEAAESFVEDIGLGVAEDTTYDILMGSAGTSLGLLALAQVSPGSAARSVAQVCGDHLLELAGQSWEPLGVKRGFSHGLSGVAYALSELAHVTQLEKYAQAALSAVEMERGLLLNGNWTDRHTYKGRPQLSWCHGAAGIALSQLGLYRRNPNERIREDLQASLSEVRRGYWMESQCLCHGSLGNLEPCLIADSLPDLEQDVQFVQSAARGVLSDIETSGWVSMLPSQTLSDGLMTGITGIGFAFLRLHAPDRVPSVLMLDPPLENCTLAPILDGPAGS